MSFIWNKVGHNDEHGGVDCNTQCAACAISVKRLLVDFRINAVIDQPQLCRIDSFIAQLGDDGLRVAADQRHPRMKVTLNTRKNRMIKLIGIQAAPTHDTRGYKGQH